MQVTMISGFYKVLQGLTNIPDFGFCTVCRGLLFLMFRVAGIARLSDIGVKTCHFRDPIQDVGPEPLTPKSVRA